MFSVGIEPDPTSASLMLIDRFFFGADFFPTFSSFFLFVSFFSTLGISPPSVTFSFDSGTLSDSFLPELCFTCLIEDFVSLFFDFFPFSLPLVSPSSTFPSETLAI